MINESIVISQRSKNSARVSWSSPNADDISFNSVNGVLNSTPIYFDTVERYTYISMTDAENKSVTVQDFPVLIEGIGPAEVFENKRPTFKFSAVDGAVKYRIYHTAFGEAEKLIYDSFQAEKGILTLTCPIVLAEGWHLFRIESVDTYGNESTRLSWPHEVYRLPEPVNDLDIVNGSGANLFDITIS